jgi:hypothetical protein
MLPDRPFPAAVIAPMGNAERRLMWFSGWQIMCLK